MEPPTKRLRAFGMYAGGMAGALLVAAALLAATGSFVGFWDWTIRTLYGYASASWTPALVLMRAKDSLIPFVLTSIVFWVAAVAFAWRWRRLPRPAPSAAPPGR